MDLRSEQAASSLDDASRTALEALQLEPEFARAPRLSALLRLGVTHVLRGSLALEDNVVRVNQHLIELDTQKTTWAMRRERPMDKLLVLERGLSRQIAEGLALDVSQQGSGAGIGAADPFILARFREGMLSMTRPGNTIELLQPGRFFGHQFQERKDPNGVAPFSLSANWQRGSRRP